MLDNDTLLMNASAKSALQKQITLAEMHLLSMQNILGNLEVWRDREQDTWGDVGLMNSINEKINDIHKTLAELGERRLPDDDE